MRRPRRSSPTRTTSAPRTTSPGASAEPKVQVQARARLLDARSRRRRRRAPDDPLEPPLALADDPAILDDREQVEHVHLRLPAFDQRDTFDINRTDGGNASGV